MSFDLYFVRRPAPGQSWDHVMERLEEAAAEQAAPTPEDRELWDRVVAAVAPIVPEGEVFKHERSQTFDDGVGLQLSMYPGEISINTPYWFDGEEAENVVDRLRAVAAAVEEATGLVTYDPQSGGAFLESGAAEAPATFDRIHAFMANELGAQPVTNTKRPRWMFWRRGNGG